MELEAGSPFPSRCVAIDGLRLEGRVALVTGGSSGIGRSIAIALAREGASVAINYRSDRDGAADVVAAIEATGRRALAIQGDVSDVTQSAAVVDGTIKGLGDLHILVNNAGIAEDRLIYDLEPGDWLRVMSVNFGGVVNSTQAAMEHFMATRDGVIVNISSVAAERASVGTAIYGASKAAINAFTRSAALELARFGVRVNAIAPGLIDTGFAATIDDLRASPMREQVPLGFYGDAGDVANAVIFLAGPDARYITGSILTMDGGLTMTVDTRAPWRPGSGDRMPPANRDLHPSTPMAATQQGENDD